MTVAPDMSALRMLRQARDRIDRDSGNWFSFTQRNG
jgi:hypothetical protein